MRKPAPQPLRPSPEGTTTERRKLLEDCLAKGSEALRFAPYARLPSPPKFPLPEGLLLWLRRMETGEYELVAFTVFSEGCLFDEQGDTVAYAVEMDADAELVRVRELLFGVDEAAPDLRSEVIFPTDAGSEATAAIGLATKLCGRLRKGEAPGGWETAILQIRSVWLGV